MKKDSTVPEQARGDRNSGGQQRDWQGKDKSVSTFLGLVGGKKRGDRYMGPRHKP